MKRRIIVLLITLITIVTLCGCEVKTTTTQSIVGEVQKEPTTEAIYGNYFLFETVDKQEYLNFLEDFDETKYEIVNISTSKSVGGYGSDEFYMVTYKVKEIEKYS